MQHATTNTLNVEPTKDDDGFAMLPCWIAIQHFNSFETYVSWRLKWATAETLRPNSCRDCIFWIAWPYTCRFDPPPHLHPPKYWGKIPGVVIMKIPKMLGQNSFGLLCWQSHTHPSYLNTKGQLKRQENDQTQRNIITEYGALTHDHTIKSRALFQLS